MIWLIETGFAYLVSLLCGLWTEVYSRDAMGNQLFSSTWTSSLFVGPASVCWISSIWYLPGGGQKSLRDYKAKHCHMFTSGHTPSERFPPAPANPTTPEPWMEITQDCSWDFPFLYFVNNLKGEATASRTDNEVSGFARINVFLQMCNLSTNMGPILHLRDALWTELLWLPGPLREMRLREGELFPWASPGLLKCHFNIKHTFYMKHNVLF